MQTTTRDAGPEGRATPRRRGTRRADATVLAAIAAATLVGAWLRVWELGEQVLAGDEFHAFKAALHHDVRYVLTHNAIAYNPEADYSIPLALWARLVLVTRGLDEWGFRLPVVVAGIFAVPVAGFLARRLLGGLSAAAVAWLVALSPMLVLYSRFARPYGVVALGTLVGLLAWSRWRDGPRWGRGLVAAAAPALAVAFNASAAPAAAVLWSYGLLDPGGSGGAERRRRRLRWAACVAAGAALAAACVLPSLGSVGGFVLDKAGGGGVGPHTWWRAFQILLGAWDAPVAATLVAAGLAGAAFAWRDARHVLAFGLALLGVQAAVVHVLRPTAVENPLVLARYAASSWPVVLLFVGHGIARTPAWLAARLGLGAAAPAVGAVAAAALLGLLYARGPLPRVFVHPNGFTNHTHYWALPEVPFEPTAAPLFYATLAERRDAGPIVEAPWTLQWGTTVFHHYQRLHGREVRTLSVVRRDFRHPGVRLGSQVPWRDGRPDLSGVACVVVHKDVVGENLHVTGRDLSLVPDAHARYWSPRRQKYAKDARLLVRFCDGEPSLHRVYEDDWIVAYERRP